MKPIKYKTVDISVMGLSVTVSGFVYYPPEPATQIDPPESSFVEWDSVTIADQDATELFQYKPNADQLESALLSMMEN